MPSFSAFIKNYWWALAGLFLLLLSLFSPYKRAEVRCQHLFLKAEHSFLNGKTEDSLYALRLLSASFPFCPVTPRAIYISAQLYASHFKDKEKARDMLEKLRSRYPSSPYAEYADLLLSQPKKEKESFATLLLEYPSLQQLYYAVQGKKCSQLDSFWKKGDAYLAGIFYQRNELFYLFYRGKGEKCKGKEKAIGSFSSVMHNPSAPLDVVQKRDPHNKVSLERQTDLREELKAYARLESADIYYQKKRYKKAFAILKPVPKRFSKYFYVGMGDIMQKLKKRGSALNFYEKAEGLSEVSLPYFSGLPPLYQKIKLLYQAGKKEAAHRVSKALFERFKRIYMEGKKESKLSIRRRVNYLWLTLSRELVQRDEPEEGSRMLAHLLLPEKKTALDQTTDEALQLAFRLSLALGRDTQARQILHTWQKVAPEEKRVFFLHTLMLGTSVKEVDLSRIHKVIDQAAPFSVFAYYALLRYKAQSIGSYYPPFVYARIEEALAKLYRDKVVKGLGKTRARDLPKELFLADLSFAQGNFKQADSYLPSKEKPLYSYYFKFIAIYDRKPLSWRGAKERLKNILLLRKQIRHPSTGYPKVLIAYLKLIQRQDKLPALLSALVRQYPTLAYRLYLDEIQSQLSPWDQFMQAGGKQACPTDEQMEAILKTRLFLFLYRLTEIPARRHKLEETIGLSVSSAQWGTITRGVFFPYPPQAVKKLHERLAYSFSQWTEDLLLWKKNCIERKVEVSLRGEEDQTTEQKELQQLWETVKKNEQAIFARETF